MPKDAAGRVVEIGKERSGSRDHRYDIWVNGIGI